MQELKFVCALDNVQPHQAILYQIGGPIDGSESTKGRLDEIFQEIVSLKPKILIVKDAGSTTAVSGGIEAWIAVVDKYCKGIQIFYGDIHIGMLMKYYPPYTEKYPDHVFMSD